jgi:hypothetical protein
MRNKLLGKVVFIALLVLCTAEKPLVTGGNNAINWKKISVLVYTKNGKGYVHTNIAGATASIQQLGI